MSKLSRELHQALPDWSLKTLKTTKTYKNHVHVGCLSIKCLWPLAKSIRAMTLQWYLPKWCDLKLVWESGSKRDLDTYDTYALLGSRWVTISLRVDHLSASSRPRSRCVLRRPFNQKLQRPNVSTWCKLHNKKDCWLVNTVASYNFVNFCELPPSSEDRFRSLLTFHRTHSMSPASACSSHLTK